GRGGWLRGGRRHPGGTRDGPPVRDGEARPRLSVLESTRAEGGTSGYVAIQQTAAVAAAADECGYHRVWVTEHHGQPEMASSAPAVLLAYLAAGRPGCGSVPAVSNW